MATIVKILKNTELDAAIKVKSDSSGGEAIITKEMLCYKPDDESCAPGVGYKFQDITDRSYMLVTDMHWSGFNQDGHGRMFRGGDDLEHQIMAFCVGDTCQLDMQGQDAVPECEYRKEDIKFVLEGEMSLWLRIRKRNFANYSAEYASYGVYEDDTKRGPKDGYDNGEPQQQNDRMPIDPPVVKKTTKKRTTRKITK